MIAGGFEFGGAGEQRGFELLSMLDGVAQGRGSEGVKVAAGSIHDDEALVGEEASHQPRKGASRR